MAVNNINSLLKNNLEDFSQSDIIRLIKTNVTTYLRLFKHEIALSENKLLLIKYRKHLSALEIEDAETNSNPLTGLV